MGPEDGKVERHRSMNEHKCGGAPCVGPSKETKPCHIIPLLQEQIEKEKDACNEKLCIIADCQNEASCDEGICRCNDNNYGTRCEQMGK